MGVAIRVIPCLDVDAGRVVKGVNFENLRDAGDPVELARRGLAARRRVPGPHRAEEVSKPVGTRVVDAEEPGIRLGYFG